MQRLYETANNLNQKINSVLWGPLMLALLIGTGIYYTFRTGGIQFFMLPTIFKKTFGEAFAKTKKDKSPKQNITPFQALSTSLAATVGTGSIVGVATAIATGGPGAVFWMWISALFGMMTKYAEILLAVHFRKRKYNNSFVGGPMYYIRDGIGSKALAIIFSVMTIIASFGIGNMTQANSISGAIAGSLNITNPENRFAATLLIGIVIAGVAGFAIIGGVRRIGRVAELLVPFMSCFYILGCGIVILFNIKNIPAVLGMILKYAFRPMAAVGGFAGSTIATALQRGVACGVFSNEAGMGSAPIAHAAAETNSAVKQGFWGIAEVFIDTIIVCSVTAFAILVTGVWNIGIDGVNLTIAAFNTFFDGFGNIIIGIALPLFAFATIIGWSYYGEKSAEYLLGQKGVVIYRIIYIPFIVIGSTMSLKFVWTISESLNALMAVPNLIALLALSSTVILVTKKYFNNNQAK